MDADVHEPPPDGIEGWVIGLMEALGEPGAAIAVALENLFPPIPSEVILPLAGFAANRGHLNLYAAIAWTTAGSVAGALVLYGLGALFGRERLLAVVERMPLLGADDLRKAEAWFARYGPASVFFGRMVPLIRSAISVPAGIERMPLPVFLVFTTLGSLVWNTLFVLAGYLLGANWPLVERYVAPLSTFVLVACATALTAFVAVRLRRLRRERRARRAREEAESGPRAHG
ncbi:membrane protein DedA with SNARE-associated domain [Thermopolyspora flexuosa]|uniref:Membrane protein DedA with SNARE-associated domain n=2 Tax=Thermopolyspora flexuosa TaxID=103836 RepID=A0A543IU28_9ACTN|nr:DedA family protein [Thermopolyspora flexuosa]TQM74076.1 membrane protein DedA with SNARE-associated domain [Thermopolyspora flexuosa]